MDTVLLVISGMMACFTCYWFLRWPIVSLDVLTFRYKDSALDRVCSVGVWVYLIGALYFSYSVFKLI